MKRFTLLVALSLATAGCPELRATHAPAQSSLTTMGQTIKKKASQLKERLKKIITLKNVVVATFVTSILAIVVKQMAAYDARYVTRPFALRTDPQENAPGAELVISELRAAHQGRKATCAINATRNVNFIANAVEDPAQSQRWIDQLQDQQSLAHHVNNANGSLRKIMRIAQALAALNPHNAQEGRQQIRAALLRIAGPNADEHIVSDAILNNLIDDNCYGFNHIIGDHLIQQGEVNRPKINLLLDLIDPMIRTDIQTPADGLWADQRCIALLVEYCRRQEDIGNQDVSILTELATTTNDEYLNVLGRRDIINRLRTPGIHRVVVGIGGQDEGNPFGHWIALVINRQPHRVEYTIGDSCCNTCWYLPQIDQLVSLLEAPEMHAKYHALRTGWLPQLFTL